MKAHQVMIRDVISISPDASIGDAARLMIDHHISGLPVIDASGALVGILTERDFLHRREISTAHKRPRWLEFFRGPGREARDFVQEAGRKVSEIMTHDVFTVTEDFSLAEVAAAMEKHGVKRLPVMRAGQVVGIVSRHNFVRAVADALADVPDLSMSDGLIQKRLVATIASQDWTPVGLSVVVHRGIVEISGVITDENTRQAIIVAAENTAGVTEVHDHLCWVDPMSGIYFLPEDKRMAEVG